MGMRRVVQSSKFKVIIIIIVCFLNFHSRRELVAITCLHKAHQGKVIIT